jgi:hypothetical protein
MTAGRWTVVAALAGLVAAPPAPAGQQATAALTGVVVSAADANTVVRRAIVTATGAGIPTNVSVITGDDGRFVLRNLPPGRLTVTASKAGYVPTEHGAKRPGRPGTPVSLAAGEVTDVRLVLARGAVITGTVRESGGAPAAGVTVTAAPAGLAGDASRYASGTGDATTDDRGVYRIFGLAPGAYIVAVTPYRSMRDVTRLAAADIDRLLRDLEQRQAGRAMVAPPATVERRPQAYAPIFYPGTPFAADAARLRLSAGETRDAVDFTIRLLAAAAVSGVLSSWDGSPVAGTRLSLMASGPPLPIFNFATTSQPPAEDGSFSFANVAPGRYVLLATRTAQAREMGAAEPSPAWALADLTVRGDDVANVRLQLRPFLSLAGRVVFEATRLEAPEDLTSMRVGLTSPGSTRAAVTLPDGTPMPGVSPPTPAAVARDGSFRVGGILPGAYVPVSSVPGASGPNGWWLRSAMLDGRDLLDDPIIVDAASPDLSGLVLTFSDRHSGLSGRLETDEGQPATEYAIVVMAANRQYWRPGARRIRSARPATDGRFSLADLPAGDYLLSALTDLESSDLDDPAFLDQLAPHAITVTIRDGETTTQNLRIGTGTGGPGS